MIYQRLEGKSSPRFLPHFFESALLTWQDCRFIPVGKVDTSEAFSKIYNFALEEANF